MENLNVDATMDVLALAFIAQEMPMTRFAELAGASLDEVEALTNKMTAAVNSNLGNNKYVVEIYNYLKKKYN